MPARQVDVWHCLMHIIEYLGLHLGHVEITIDWWKAQESYPA